MTLNSSIWYLKKKTTKTDYDKSTKQNAFYAL